MTKVENEAQSVWWTKFTAVFNVVQSHVYCQNWWNPSFPQTHCIICPHHEHDHCLWLILILFYIRYHDCYNIIIMQNVIQWIFKNLIRVTTRLTILIQNVLLWSCWLGLICLIIDNMNDFNDETSHWLARDEYGH